MITDANKTQWIDRYLSGQLDETERGLVEEKLTTDELFRNELELQRSLKQQLRLYNRIELKKKLTALSAPGDSPDETALSSSQANAQGADQTKVDSNRWVWWIAASVLLLGMSYGVWQFFTKPVPASELIVYRLPVIDSDHTQGMGFGQQPVVLDSLVVQFIASAGKEPGYVFSDTLKLYLPQVPSAPIRWKIEYSAITVDYYLQTDTATFRIDRGFTYLRPLQPVR